MSERIGQRSDLPRNRSYVPQGRRCCEAFRAMMPSARAAGSRCRRRGAYVLLETVIATGVLLAGLAIIGAQLHEADKSVREMERELRAISLAQMHLSEMDLGLIKLDTVDPIQEEEFGPRYPDWGWRLTIEDTLIHGIFLLKLEILYSPRERFFQGFTAENVEEFDFEKAESVYTVYAMKAAPRPLDLTSELGLSEKQAEDLTRRLAEVGAGFDATEFDPTIFGTLPSDELIEILPPLLTAFGVSMEDLLTALPPDLRETFEKAGLLGEVGGEEGVEGTETNQGSNESSEEGSQP